MGEPTRQLTPGGDALGLHEAIALVQQIVSHAIEGFGEFTNLVVRSCGDPGIPISCGEFVCGTREIFDRLGYSRGRPTAEDYGEQQTSTRRKQSSRPDLCTQVGVGASRAADQQDS